MYTQPKNDIVPLLQSNFQDQDKSGKDNKKASDEKNIDAIKKTVTNQPNYMGEDVNKKRWNLKAQRAVQTGDPAKGVTTLEKVISNTISIDNSKVEYKADQGEFLNSEQVILLNGNVLIKSDNLKLETEQLKYDLPNAYAESKTNVIFTFDAGSILGDGMQSYNNADKIIITGNVQAKLYNKK